MSSDKIKSWAIESHAGLFFVVVSLIFQLALPGALSGLLAGVFGAIGCGLVALVIDRLDWTKMLFIGLALVNVIRIGFALAILVG